LLAPKAAVRFFFPRARNKPTASRVSSADGMTPPKEMETIMRNILLSGAAAFVLALSAIGANSALANEPDANAAIHHHRAAPHRLAAAAPMREGRGAAIGDAFSVRFMMDDHAHDPAFSRQQDEIYDGRF
jgi:hypothetical protein